MADRNLKKSNQPSPSPSAATSNKKIQIPQNVAPIRIKILSIGTAGTGKSCLIKRFCEERFVSKYIATIGKLNIIV